MIASQDPLTEVPQELLSLPGLQAIQAPQTRQFERAAEILEGEITRNYSLYPAMPAWVLDENKKLLMPVGLLPKGAGKHEIVAVDLETGRVVHYPNNAPPTSRAESNWCGWAYANQPGGARGTPGTFAYVRRHGDEELWSMTITRPSVSSGNWGSGIDLTNIRYKGVPLISQIHVPILNVLYDQNACGPYRDWQWAENSFSAEGEDVAPGIRKCTSAPQTIMESHNDTGNFLGVAIWEEPTKVTLVSELSAGWYRYISKFEFHDDGTLKPIFGFSAVSNSCVCKKHTHHAYWRMDFNLIDGDHDVFEASQDGQSWETIVEEKKFKKNDPYKYFRVRHQNLNQGYRINPGRDDGVADDYGKGDVWAVHYATNEIEDRAVYTNTSANLDAFVNGESTNGTHLVVWYGAHYMHDEHGSENDEEHSHAFGPTMQLIANP